MTIDDDDDDDPEMLYFFECLDLYDNKSKRIKIEYRATTPEDVENYKESLEKRGFLTLYARMAHTA